MNKYLLIKTMVNSRTHAVEIPTIDKAKELANDVEMHNAKSFENVVILRYHAPISITNEQFDAMMVIYEAYIKGKEIFEQYDYSS